MFFWKKEAPEEDKNPHQTDALAVTRRILDGMGVEATIEHLKRDERLVLNLSCGQDDNMVIGRKGKTLEALQFIINRIVCKRFPDEKPVLIDVGGYRERRRHNLEELSRRSAQKVKDTVYPVIIGPYNAYERHIVHSVVQDDPEVFTESQGEGDFKKIVFRLRNAEEPSTGE
jgi:spoIIIJ-associated protein